MIGLMKRPWFWMGLALVLIYGVRAVIGVAGGRDLWIGLRNADHGYHTYAIDNLERGSIGIDRPGALWLRGLVRVQIWKMRYTRFQEEQLDRLLTQAHTELTEAISMSPSAGWTWRGLANVYDLQEEGERARQPFDLDLMAESPWRLIGRPGRIAIGLHRIAIEREPTNYRFYDELSDLMRDYDLPEPALEVLAQSAAIQPLSALHDMDPITPEVLEAFARGSRAALGKTRYLSRARHLTALGIVEARRGNWKQSEADLRRSLALSGHRLHRAETHYHLGAALAEQGRHEEALAEMGPAREHPNLIQASLRLEARIFETTGRLEEALALWRRLRRLDSRSVRYALEFSRVAVDLERSDQGMEALEWARLVNPDDATVLVRTIELRLRRGETAQASRLFDELIAIEGPAGEIARLRARLGPPGTD